MKKHAETLLLLLCLLTFSAYSQHSRYLGIKGGLSIPNLQDGSSANPINSGYGSRLGLDAAVQAAFQLKDRFSFQLELEYCAQGGRKNSMQAFPVPPELAGMFPPGQAPEYLYAHYSSEARINYLMLPLLAKYHVHSGKHWDAYAAVGPFVSLVLTAKNITRGSSNIYLDAAGTQPVTPSPQSFDNTQNIRNDLHAFNAGVSGHIGIAHKINSSAIFLEAGGNYGFINIQKGNGNGKNKTGAAVVNLGYQLSFGIFE